MLRVPTPVVVFVRTVPVFEVIDRRAVVPDVPKQHLPDDGLPLCRAVTRLFRVVLRGVPLDHEPPGVRAAVPTAARDQSVRDGFSDALQSSARTWSDSTRTSR